MLATTRDEVPDSSEMEKQLFHPLQKDCGIKQSRLSTISQ